MAGGKPGGGNVPIVLIGDGSDGELQRRQTFYLTPNQAACVSPTRQRSRRRQTQKDKCYARVQTRPAEVQGPCWQPAPEACAPAPPSRVARRKHQPGPEAPG